MKIWLTVPLGKSNKNIHTFDFKLYFYIIVNFRFGIGRFTTIEEVDYIADKCIKHVERLREMSPLWEMVQEGIDIKTIQWSQH